MLIYRGMKLIYLSFILGVVFSVSCSVSQLAQDQGRKAIPPQGSTESDMPWNTPQAGEGGGALGGLMNQYR